jgi:hypothetical protein
MAGGFTCAIATGARDPDCKCGNGVFNSTEACDGQDVGGINCTDYGYTNGNVTCDSNCALVTATCGKCTSDNDCAGNELNKKCDPASGACVGCLTNEDCDTTAGRACLQKMCVGNTQIGQPCSDPYACGANAFCMMFEPDVPLYCSKYCSTDTDCPESMHCALNADGAMGACLNDCTSDLDCGNADYRCVNGDETIVLGNTTTECFPYASGTGKPGATCTGMKDCEGGLNGACIIDPSMFPDGFCVTVCERPTTAPDPADPDPCGTESHCSTYNLCLPNCTAGSPCTPPGVTNATAGYICEDWDLSGIGQLIGMGYSDQLKECMPTGAAGSTGKVGTACESVAQCQSAPQVICNPPSEQFPGGYCSANNCDLAAFFYPACAAGSHCVGSACVDDCTTDTDCRPGYTCADVDGSGKKACTTTPQGTSPIGGRCNDFNDCGTGPGGFCLYHPTQIPNGFCVKPCKPAAANSCPTGYACTGRLGCAQSCTSNADCRADMTCQPLDQTGTKKACLPQ